MPETALATEAIIDAPSLAVKERQINEKGALTRYFNASAPLSLLRAAYHRTNKTIDGLVPAYVVRDSITRKLIGAGTIAYLVDMWDPLPIGETIALCCASLAALRGGIRLGRRSAQNSASVLDHNYDFQI